METQRMGSQALKEKHAFLDTIPVAFLLTDHHGKILFANQPTEALFGYGRLEIEGQRIRTLFLEDDLLYFFPNILYLTLEKGGFSGEALLRRKDGTKVFVHLSTTSFREGGEDFLTFSFQGIERLKNLEKERVEEERWSSLGRMVEEIAHQVRNPVVSIGGFTKRLQKFVTSSSKGQSYLDQILHETTKLEVMIRRLEEYVHLPKPSYQKWSLREVVEQAFEIVSKEALEEGILLTVESKSDEKEECPFVDRELVASALSKVLKNGIDALTSSPVPKSKKIIRVTILDDGEHVGISVKDRGEGIPGRNLKLLCEPFFSTRPDRVGLGLTFVRRVMKEHGGTLRIESRVKRGTTVTLFLPKDRRRRIRRELLSPESEARES